MPADLFNDLVKSLAWLPAQMEKLRTFCFNFSLEVLRDSEHFKKIDTHFEADGMVCTYRCSLDNRVYTVKVTPSKD
jgi:hypothetical protein